MEVVLCLILRRAQARNAAHDMGANSGIQWTDHTFNPWIGCTKVSPGCDHCYAEAYAKRYGTATWGSGQPRKLTSDSNWKLPLKWNREAETEGRRYRVFCASLADVFDNEVPQAWRTRLWNLIVQTPHLDWLLLTKRIGNAEDMLPPDWGQGWPNVWLGASIVNQQEADRDIPKLLAVPAKVRFLSMEPLLGAVEFSNVSKRSDAIQQLGKKALSGIDWVIVGGESGPGARPMHPDWARSLRDQCAAAGVAFHFKQWGEWVPTADVGFGDWPKAAMHTFKTERTISTFGGPIPLGIGMLRIGKKSAGRLLDGREWNELPIVSRSTS